MITDDESSSLSFSLNFTDHRSTCFSLPGRFGVLNYLLRHSFKKIVKFLNPFIILNLP